MAALATPRKTYVRCIGLNDRGQLGIGNKETIRHRKQLIKCDWSQNIKIRNIHASNRGYTLVEDMDGNYYSAGFNGLGACTVNDTSDEILTMTPITCLKENNLKISQVFVNTMGDAPFWK
eukprot:941541_1